MTMLLSLILCLALCSATLNAFRVLPVQRGFVKSSTFSLKGLLEGDLMAVGEELNFVVGEDVPPEVFQMQAIYDMVLVERLHSPQTTNSGLFLPKVEGKDRKHLGMVLSVPTAYGLESEGGLVVDIQTLAPYKKGDLVILRDPWGIGPCNMEIGQRCFSFHKAEHITGVISK